MKKTLNRREIIAKAAIFSIAPGILSACGFALKGQARLPFDSVFLDAAATGPVASALRRYLRGAAGTRFIEKASLRNTAAVILQITQDANERRTVGANAYGLTREVQLYTRFHFSAVSPTGKVLLEPVELQQRRDIAFTEAVALSKEGEEQLLFDAMREDLASQVMRRLEAIQS